MNNLIFIGMPTAGKSTVGVVVAKRLGYGFIDSDLLIQAQEGCLLKDIIAAKGIDGFLEIENQVNRDITAERSVIAPGGSAIYCMEAMEHFKEIGTVIYLQASYQTICERLGSARERGVVLKDGQTLKDLYEERTRLFERYADITICEDGITMDETIEAVLDRCRPDTIGGTING